MATTRTRKRPTTRGRDHDADLHKWATQMYAWLQNQLHPWHVKVSRGVPKKPGREIQPPPTPPKYPPARR